MALKALRLPWILHRLIRRLDVRWDVEGLINVPTTMLIGMWPSAACGTCISRTTCFP